ncbi:hypothetical protein DPV78_007080 [Talaromyces pinophilus]|nr:hypothetical protein DPV78_007080 [Talaromyces pinophilus]
MAWPLDQPSWEQNQIYGNPLADASGLVPPFLAGVEPAVATDYGAYLNLSTNDVHHLAHGHQSYRAMSASAPSQWAAITGPNIPTQITGTMNDPRSAINQPPIVPAGRYPEPKSRTRKKTSIRVTEYATIPGSPSSPTNSISNHFFSLAQSPTPAPLRLSNASGKAAITLALSAESMNFSVTFGQNTSPL